MAITQVEYALIRKFREVGILKSGGSLIEFGQSNWYGDVPLEQLDKDIDLFAPAEKRAALRARLQRLLAEKPPEMLFDIAAVFHACFLDPVRHVAVDYGGTKLAQKLDLNAPLPDLGQFDVAIDFGTGEHIFDIKTFFENVHNVTAPGGVIIHGLPWHGFIDHGFYNFQPTLFFDMAAANGYRVLNVSCGAIEPPQVHSLNTREACVAFAKSGKIPANALLLVAYQKGPAAQPFRVPVQGYYAGALSAELNKDWQTMR
ncbi:MAG: hypothetical protein IT566_04865 [Rhodospirillaceae bacterium]|nr:hypothetical protein [Rhodospirillaceae bacterium]